LFPKCLSHCGILSRLTSYGEMCSAYGFFERGLSMSGAVGEQERKEEEAPRQEDGPGEDQHFSPAVHAPM
jgi:hypothetical protein